MHEWITAQPDKEHDYAENIGRLWAPYAVNHGRRWIGTYTTNWKNHECISIWALEKGYDTMPENYEAPWFSLMEQEGIAAWMSVAIALRERYDDGLMHSLRPTEWQVTDMSDRGAIENLMVLYTEALDGGAFEPLGELFEHGSVTIEGGPHSGRQAAARTAVAELYRSIVALDPDLGVTGTRHFITNIFIEIDDAGRNAIGRSYFAVTQQTTALPLQLVACGGLSRSLRSDRRHVALRARRIVCDQVGDLSQHMLLALDKSRRRVRGAGRSRYHPAMPWLVADGRVLASRRDRRGLPLPSQGTAGPRRHRWRVAAAPCSFGALVRDAFPDRCRVSATRTCTSATSWRLRRTG